MSPSPFPDAAGGIPPRTLELIADVRTGDEALRRQVEHLARLREAAREAATQEAAAILATARAEIRRITIDARSRLLALKTQLEAIVEPGSELDAALAALRGDMPDDDLAVLIAEYGDVPDSVREVRRDLQRLLGDDRPDPLPAPAPASLPAPAAVLRTSAQTAATEAVTPSGAELPKYDREPEHGPAVRAELFASSPHEAKPQHPAHNPKRILTLLAVVVAITAGLGGGWWLMTGRQAFLQAPVASIPAAPRPAAPLVSTGGEIPTLTASLIALPLPATERADSATVPQSGPLTLDVDVRRAVWMRVSIDDAPAAGRMFQPGAPLHFSAARTVAITAGDGGAVPVSTNGGPRTVVGRDGQVVNRRFAASDPPQR